MFRKLNPQQKNIVFSEDNLLLTACPGSGKTRVLTYKIAYELEKTKDSKKHVVALTFTNRAAEEISSRVENMHLQDQRLWTGTLHAFCLEWILRPYSAYCAEIKNGFQVLDQYTADKLLQEIKKANGTGQYENVITKLNRNGVAININPKYQKVAIQYHQALRELKVIDYDQIIYLSFRLLLETPKIPKALSRLISLICIDEYQDTQDLQYGIVSTILNAGSQHIKVFFVGDPDQAIYGTLGGVAKTESQIQVELKHHKISSDALTGCYRSTQRIVDYFSNFQLQPYKVEAIGSLASKKGLITFDSKISKSMLYVRIRDIVIYHLNAGVPVTEICITAPEWSLVIECAREMMKLLPHIKFDAPGISPFAKVRDNIWYKITRLILTPSSPKMFATRFRWTKDVMHELVFVHGVMFPEALTSTRLFLRRINRCRRGLQGDFISEIYSALSELASDLKIDLTAAETLNNSLKEFIENARTQQQKGNLPTACDDVSGLFKEKEGIVISTCHGLKGEEYTTVIAFGLLYGKIPFWDVIINKPEIIEVEALKLLYVIGSRAKLNLHLFAESGRVTNNGKAYLPTPFLQNIKWPYDSLA